MRRITCLAYAASAILALPTAGAQRSPPDAPTRPVSAFAETWNRHDMHAFGLLFEPDAEFVNVTASWWKGRAAIERNHAFLHGTIPRSDTAAVTANSRNYGIFAGTTIVFDSIVVRTITPTLALVHAPWSLNGDPRASTPRRGLFLFVLRKAHGRWNILTAQNTELARPAVLDR